MKLAKGFFTQKPCKEAVKWLKSQDTMQDAWNNCECGDWMWWALIHYPGAMPDKELSVA